MGDAATLAGRVTDGLARLREGRPAEARRLLEDVARDPDFRAASDLEDVRVRVLSLLAQAAFESGDPATAEAAAGDALRRARLLGDTEGISEITALADRIRERRARTDGPTDAQALRLARTGVPELLAIRDPVARAEALLRKAALPDTDPAEVLVAAEHARREAAAVGDLRVQVLALLCVAHADPAGAAGHLAAAHATALDGTEVEVATIETLVAAIARTATQLGVPLPAHRGPLQ